MASRDRTVTDKVGDWLTAYNAIAAELTPPGMRAMSSTLMAPPTDAQDLEAVTDYVQRVNLAGGVVKVVMANDRAAAVVAAMLTQSGVSRPQLDVIEGGE